MWYQSDKTNPVEPEDGLDGLVLRNAVSWWESKRPLEFSEKDHLLNPTINCSTESEKELAKSISRMLSEFNEIVSVEDELEESIQGIKAAKDRLRKLSSSIEKDLTLARLNQISKKLIS